MEIAHTMPNRKDCKIITISHDEINQFITYKT